MELFCPFAGSRNPATDAVELQTQEWAMHFGLLADHDARQQFIASRFTELMGRAYPTADETTLALIGKWNAWTFLVDTQLDHHALGRTPVRLAALAHAIDCCLSGDMQAIAPDAEPLLCALRDITTRLYAQTSLAWQQRFRNHVMATLSMCVHEAQQRQQGQYPTEHQYLTMRPHTSGCLCFFDLIEFAARIVIPNAVHAHLLLQELTMLAMESVYLANDVVSLPKELAQDDGHNLVLIVQRERGFTLAAATEIVIERHNHVVQRFITARAQLSDFGTHAEAVQHYVTGLKTWMRANIDWSSITARYQTRLEPSATAA